MTGQVDCELSPLPELALCEGVSPQATRVFDYFEGGGFCGGILGCVGVWLGSVHQ